MEVKIPPPRVFWRAAGVHSEKYNRDKVEDETGDGGRFGEVGDKQAKAVAGGQLCLHGWERRFQRKPAVESCGFAREDNGTEQKCHNKHENEQPTAPGGVEHGAKRRCAEQPEDVIGKVNDHGGEKRAGRQKRGAQQDGGEKIDGNPCGGKVQK